MRPVNLTVVEGGIQRLREKGGASEKSLWDLVNGYITVDRKIKNRPGTARVFNLPSSTKGLCHFDGSFHVFSHETVAVPAGVTLHILQHPELEDEDGSPIPLNKIHFAEPFMGALYVVAEFDIAIGGDIEQNVYHFWLRGQSTTDAWRSETEYQHGQRVEPTTPTGRVYKATRLGNPNPSWTPDTPRALNDLVEPTTYNEFYYEAILVAGSDPRSGETEPDWPTETGEQVIEDAGGEEASAQPPVAPDFNIERYFRGARLR